MIRYSSNIGIVQFAARLDAARAVRGAARLRLRHADRVCRIRGIAGHSARAALLVAAVAGVAGDGLRDLGDARCSSRSAYVAIANGGELLEPALVKEVRALDGRVLYPPSGASYGAC